MLVILRNSLLFVALLSFTPWLVAEDLISVNVEGIHAAARKAIEEEFPDVGYIEDENNLLMIFCTHMPQWASLQDQIEQCWAHVHFDEIGSFSEEVWKEGEDCKQKISSRNIKVSVHSDGTAKVERGGGGTSTRTVECPEELTD